MIEYQYKCNYCGTVQTNGYIKCDTCGQKDYEPKKITKIDTYAGSKPFVEEEQEEGEYYD